MLGRFTKQSRTTNLSRIITIAFFLCFSLHAQAQDDQVDDTTSSSTKDFEFSIGLTSKYGQELQVYFEYDNLTKRRRINPYFQLSYGSLESKSRSPGCEFSNFNIPDSLKAPLVVTSYKDRYADLSLGFVFYALGNNMSQRGLQLLSGLWYRIGGLSSEDSYGLELGAFYRFYIKSISLSLGFNFDWDLDHETYFLREVENDGNPNGSVMIRLGRTF